MGTAERRGEIMRLLYRRKHETIGNLASELGVSERTVSRDIDALSASEPIYTEAGKYGGVYIVDSFQMDRMYISPLELDVLEKLLNLAREKAMCDLSVQEEDILCKIVKDYNKRN